jgi:hypothetical protein
MQKQIDAEKASGEIEDEEAERKEDEQEAPPTNGAANGSKHSIDINVN